MRKYIATYTRKLSGSNKRMRYTMELQESDIQVMFTETKFEYEIESLELILESSKYKNIEIHKIKGS